MTPRICREFYFDAAHYLPNYKGKCENMHGHTYKLEVCVSGKIKGNGMVMDFNELKGNVEVVMEKLDHKNLNEIFEAPTAENIAAWIFSELKKKVVVCSVKLWEGDGKWVEVTE
ncbi:MAG: 6-carboxytetrahydropterin synthase QueD [Candidatus Altiarchaeales archaeon IMC4]|nr:MAG: 6-carboxytetrahydropterin synthase QueD [Candidatus Altiarchaeales archaeon IMC4]